jgi:hypothetical protein
MRPCKDQRNESQASARTARFAVYIAALDREETAAAAYGEWLGVLDRRRRDSNRWTYTRELRS